MPLNDPLRFLCDECGASEGELCVSHATGDPMPQVHRCRQLSSIPRTRDPNRIRERMATKPKLADRIRG